MKQVFFVGIDGGGSHSRLSLIDQDKNQVFYTTAGSVNITSAEPSVVAENISLLFGELREFFRSYSPNSITDNDTLPVAQVVFASAGADTPNYITIYKNLLEQYTNNAALSIMNEGECLLKSLWNHHHSSKPDLLVLLIAGTGIISYSYNCSHEIKRKSGWGHIIDDTGSAFWISQRALKLAIRRAELEGDTLLLEDLLKRIGLNNSSLLIDYVNGDPNYRRKIAALCPYFIEWQDQHSKKIAADEIKKILEQAITEWCLQINKHVEEYSLSQLATKAKKDSVVCYVDGSLITSNTMYAAFKTKLSQSYTVSTPPFEPCYGAAVLAQRLYQDLQQDL